MPHVVLFLSIFEAAYVIRPVMEVGRAYKTLSSEGTLC
jgi:hypothetical protein